MGETAIEIPRVSVVMPAFNAAATLERAITSALAQAPVAVEVIVVDDRSTDGTPEIAARWAAKGVRLIENARNLGASESRNVAIRAARGDMIAFLDADDEWRPGKLAAQLALAEGDPARTLIHCDGAYVGPDGREFDRVYNHAPPVDGPEAWRALIRYCFIHTSCVMAPRAVLLELGGFDAKLVVAEDQDLWIRLALEGAVAHLPEILTTIHDMPGSLMKREATRERDFVLPMIAGHIAAQRRRLSRREVRAALGARLTQIGRRAYANGAR
ncbi:MAG: glycosyltransferase family 2 protein, partial [Alphaproteobacteria bacterium]